MSPMAARPALTSPTSVSLSGVWSSEPALAFMPFSHASAASLPSALAIEVTIGQKSVSSGASSSLPLYFGLASAIAVLGTSEAEILLGL
jgi:hypothetical protein